MTTALADELDIQPGHRVLEICGGSAETGPYDRILVTEPVRRVRWEWAEQLVPGGLLSVDVTVAERSGGHVILRREPDRLAGRFCPLWRSCPVHRKPTFPGPHDFERHYLATGDESTTTLDPTLYDIGALWLMFVAAPPRLEITIGKCLDIGDGLNCYSFADTAGSWAAVEMTGSGPDRWVRQAGPRRLWTELERAHQVWTTLGRPQYEDVGMTVTSDGQWISLAGQGVDWRMDLLP